MEFRAWSRRASTLNNSRFCAADTSEVGTSRHFAGLQNWVAIRGERTWPQLAASSTRSRKNDPTQTYPRRAKRSVVKALFGWPLRYRSHSLSQAV
jgi:hypothetical protein